MSEKTCDIITLAGNFKTEIELQDYSNKQYIALKKAAEKISKLEEEVTHLKSLLSTTTQLIASSNVEKVIVTPEEAICEEQIRVIQGSAFQRELTLEEIKKLDLLIKNKRLAKNEPTTIDGKSSKIDKSKITNAELLEIAKTGDKEPSYE